MHNGVIAYGHPFAKPLSVWSLEMYHTSRFAFSLAQNVRGQLHIPCGKIVQNLWKVGGKTCQYLSTLSVETKSSHTRVWVKPSFIPHVIPGFPLNESTSKTLNLSLLIHSFTHNPHPLLLTPRRKN